MPNGRKKLWGIGGFREDPYVYAEMYEIVDDHKIILPLERWKQEIARVCFENHERTGVFIAANENIEPLFPFLTIIPVIALDFPTFDDGRSYSKAVQLKTFHHYPGELRAVGDVLIDQVSNMMRCGFDTLEIKHLLTQERLSTYSDKNFPGFYQSGVGFVRGQRRVWYATSEKA